MVNASCLGVVLHQHVGQRPGWETTLLGSSYLEPGASVGEAGPEGQEKQRESNGNRRWKPFTGVKAKARESTWRSSRRSNTLKRHGGRAILLRRRLLWLKIVTLKKKWFLQSSAMKPCAWMMRKRMEMDQPYLQASEFLAHESWQTALGSNICMRIDGIATWRKKNCVVCVGGMGFGRKENFQVILQRNTSL